MKELDAVLRRVSQLRQLHAHRDRAKDLIRDVCGDPEKGLKALLGDLKDTNPYTVPAANMVLSGITRLGQKIGRVPDLRVEPPIDNDKKRARKEAEKRARIVQSWDEEGDEPLESVLDQVGLWLPGYTFGAWVIKEGVTEDGDPYPELVNLDPYGTYPAPTRGGRQPGDLAYIYSIPARDLAEKYPEHRTAILGRQMSGGGVLLDPSDYAVASSSWMGQTASYGQASVGVDVAEYYDGEACWVVLPEKRLMLERYVNPLRSAQFIVGNKVSFSDPVGQYDHGMGLQSTIAQFNSMAALAFKEGILTERNVYGTVLSNGGKYTIGHRAVNIMDPGSKVERPALTLPYQLMQEVKSLQDQFRITTGYSPVDDAVSPAAQATGQGIDRLTAGIDNEVKQYLTILRRMLELKDRKQLEWMDRHPYRNRVFAIYGSRRGDPFAEEYSPAKDINGQYRTKRNFGAMAGLDDQNKITALQLLRSGENPLIDTQSAMEELDLGGRSVSQVQKRLEKEKADRVTWAMLLAKAEQGDPAAVLAVIEIRNGGDPDTVFRKFFTPQSPEPSEAELAMLAPPATPQGPPPDIASVLQLMQGGGGAPMPPGMPAGAVA